MYIHTYRCGRIYRRGGHCRGCVSRARSHAVVPSGNTYICTGIREHISKHIFVSSRGSFILSWV